MKVGVGIQALNLAAQVQNDETLWRELKYTKSEPLI